MALHLTWLKPWDENLENHLIWLDFRDENLEKNVLVSENNVLVYYAPARWYSHWRYQSCFEV